ncbi:MAG: multidrug effflux MFS transporter [Pseudomonadota bacterium]
MLNPRSTAATALLAALVAFGPLATDMYLPSLPTLMRVFDTTQQHVQLTLSLYLLGFAIGQLAYGPLSDRFGRRPMLMIGLALFIVASVAITSVDSIEAMIVWRVLQALGGCAGPVLGRAIVRDVFGPDSAARVLSYISAAMALAPAVAPMIGGLLDARLGWTSVFFALAVYGAIVLAMFATQLPETAPREIPTPFRLSTLTRNFGVLMKNSRWRYCTLACSSVYAGTFAFLSGSSFVIIDHYGFSSEQYGYVFGVIVTGYIISTLIGGKISARHTVDTLIGMGSVLAAISACAMLLLTLSSYDSVLIVTLPTFFYAMSMGWVMPQSMAGALAPFPQMAGTASSLLGTVQMLLAAAMGAIVGVLSDGTPLAMTACMAIAGVATLISYLGLRNHPESH